MKYIFTLMICLCLCLAVGCSPATETPTDVSSAVDSSAVDTKEVTLDIAYSRYWTWNDLYDYLESPLQSGNLCFDPDTQTLFLFAVDGQTKITRWDTPLEDGMVSILYDKDGVELRRFLVHITDAPQRLDQSESTQPIPSQVSIPDPSNPNASSDPAVPSQKTVITLRGKSNKALKKAVDEFNKQSRTVSVVLTDGDELFSAAGLARECNTSLCPDLVLMDYSQYTVAAKKGLLTSFSQADQAPFGLKISGPTHGILLGQEVFCLAANQEILYHCKVALPETFDQLMDAARQVKQTLPDTLPMGFPTHSDSPRSVAMAYADLLYAEGGCLLTPDCDASAFYSHYGVLAINRYADNLKEGLIAAQYSDEDFVKGNTAFGRVSSKQYEQVFGSLARHNYAPLPLLLPNNVGGTVQSYYYCVPQNNDKTKTAAAYELLTYLLTDADTVTALCRTAGLVPKLPAARQNKVYQTDAWQILLDEADRGINPPALECVDTVYGYVTQAILSVMDGKDPETALAHARDLTERRLVRK